MSAFSKLTRLLLGLPFLALIVLVAFFSLSPVPAVHAAEPAPFYCSKTYDPSSLTTLTQTSTTLTCPGVSLGDFVDVSNGVSNAAVTITAYVSAANTVTILVFNGSAGTIDLASATYRVRVVPHYQ